MILINALQAHLELLPNIHDENPDENLAAFPLIFMEKNPTAFRL